MNENPYNTPSSDVEVKSEKKRSIFWKIYFFFLVLLSIVGYIEIYSIEGGGIAEAISLLIALPATVGLFGYVFCKKILTPSVWLPVLILSITYGVVYYQITNVDLAAGMDSTTYLITQGVGWVISVPAYIALYLYSRPTNFIWASSPDKPMQLDAAEPHR